MMKAGTETGSLINHIYSANGDLKPEVGMGCTTLHWTDRHAATVIKVSPSGKTITVQEDTATRVDTNGMSESQFYEYRPNPNGRTWTFRQTTKGWRSGSVGLSLGHRASYHDYSF